MGCQGMTQDRQERVNRLITEFMGLMEKDLDDLLRSVGGTDFSQLFQMPRGSRGPYQVLFLDPTAPEEIVKVVYKYLAQRLHPDRGGSTEAMARLNRAYEEIGKMRGWKA